MIRYDRMFFSYISEKYIQIWSKGADFNRVKRQYAQDKQTKKQRKIFLIFIFN